MNRQHKQIVLGTGISGVNSEVLWEHPNAGSQIDFSSFQHVAQTAERGRFDYFFLPEGLALRARGGELFEHDIAGRPDTLPVLAAIASVTEHIGLVGTINSTFNEPYELARLFATLDQLSGGRAGWNVVTSYDEFTGGNFRRGAFLPHAERYRRAEQTLHAVQTLWDSWAEDDLVADPVSGRFLARGDAGAFALRSEQFDIAGHFTVPRSPQGRPVIIQAGVSPQGRDFAAANADVIYSPYHRLPEAQEFYRDIHERAARLGRIAPKILPSVGVVLGDSAEDARERAHELRRQQLTDTTIRVQFEQLWNRDLSGYELDGPVPDAPPLTDGPSFIQGRSFHVQDRHQLVREYRELAEAKGWTFRQLADHVYGRVDFVGTALEVADAIDGFVQQDGADGVVIRGHVVPHGIDEFVDKVVPLLQERGSLRTEYEGSTLRENLGLPFPERGVRAAEQFAAVVADDAPRTGAQLDAQTA